VEASIAVNPLTALEQEYAIKTWRYLRLALVALVIGLLTSVADERLKVDCWQKSLSAYYYTPVHGLFVGGLVGVGICMMCLKGSTPVEDLLLNIGGVFAIIVGAVPTPGTGSCGSELADTSFRNAYIDNNALALGLVGAAALTVLAVLGLRSPSRHDPRARAGYCTTALTWVVFFGVFLAQRKLFRDYAHHAAALGVFASVTAVVFVNARHKREVDAQQGRGASLRNRYLLIGWVMVAAGVVLFVAGRAGFSHWLLVAEVALISLFAVFWLTQTVELWHRGLR
jgi:hypothetical protein